METKQLDYLKKLANRYKSKSLPIIDQTIACKNGHVSVCDLDTMISFKAELWDEGVYNILGQKVEEIEEFPRINTDISKLKAVTFLPTTTPLLEFVPFTGNDELRPVMNGIYFDKKEMVASDAHVLKCEPHKLRVKAPFLMPVKFAKELAGLLKLYDKPVELFSDGKYMVCENMHFKATFRLVEATYPNYKGVMPPPDDNGIKVTFPIKEITQVHKDAKATKIKTALIFDVVNKKCFVKDLGEETYIAEFPLVVEDKNHKKYTMLIMPVHNYEDDSLSGVNIDFVNKCKVDYLYLHTTNPGTRAIIC